jgi:hypothetical protein
MVARSAWEVSEGSREDLNVLGQPAKEEGAINEAHEPREPREP